MTAITSPVAPHAHAPAASASRYLVLVGAVMIQLILGTVYGYSIFWTPLQSEVFPPVLTESAAQARIASGVSVDGAVVVSDDAAARAMRDRQQGALKYAFSICVMSFALVMVIAGRVQDVLGPRTPALIGGALMGGGFLLAGLMAQPIVFVLAHAALCGVAAIVLMMLATALVDHWRPGGSPMAANLSLAIAGGVTVAGVLIGNEYVGRLGAIDRLLLLWGTIGVLAGAGIGFAYVCPIAALVKWFPNSKGLVAGVAVAGFGLGAFLFKDPHFGAPAFFKTYGITTFFLVHGLVCLAAISLGALLLRNPPALIAPSRPTGDSNWRQMLTRPTFYTLWTMYFSGSLAGLMVISIIAEFAKEQLAAAAGPGLDAQQLAAIALKGGQAVGWLAIFNAAGRIFWGLVSDLVGRTATFVVNFLLQAAVMAVLSSMNTELAIIVAASLVGFNYGGLFALFPSATADLFGARNLGANYGWVFTSYGVAGVLGVAAGNTAKIATGSYHAAFMLASALCVASAGLAIVLAAAQRRVLATMR